MKTVKTSDGRVWTIVKEAPPSSRAVGTALAAKGPYKLYRNDGKRYAVKGWL